MSQPDNWSADVIVVGAGLAGLTAGYRLAQATQSVIVLEARDRVGGRTLTKTINGHSLDFGAQWVGPKQFNIMRLIDELGLHCFRQYNQGKKIFETGGHMLLYNGDLPVTSDRTQAAMQATLAEIDLLSQQVPLADPLAADRAGEWDALSVRDWLQENVADPEVRELLELSVRGLFTCEPPDLSFLFFLLYLRSGGGLQEMYDIEGGAQQDRLVEGTQTLSIRLAERLSGHGSRVVLNAPVQTIEQTSEVVTIRTAEADYRARYVIVAAPPILAGQINYQPPLPSERQSLFEAMPMGSVIKCIATYAQPFWRAAGYAGEAYSANSPICFIFDDCSPDGRQGALVAFFAGDAAREWSRQPSAERQAVVLRELARFFGPAAAAPLDFIEQDWVAEPWSRGCYSAVCAPGVLSQYRFRLREPVGRIHWAGTETAQIGIGYLDGAVESGERAANEVLSKLR